MREGEEALAHSHSLHRRRFLRSSSSSLALTLSLFRVDGALSLPPPPPPPPPLSSPMESEFGIEMPAAAEAAVQSVGGREAAAAEGPTKTVAKMKSDETT